MTDDKDQEIADLKARLAALEEKGANTPPPTAAPAPTQSGGCALGVAWVVGVLVLLIVIAGIAGQLGGSHPATNTAATNAPATTAAATNGAATNTVASGAPANSSQSPDIATTGNVLNDALLRKSQADQVRILARIVAAHCHGTRAFYDGIGHQGMFAGTAYWSVACRDGQSFMVSISPDDKDNKAMECSVMRAVAGVDCFTRF